MSTLKALLTLMRPANIITAIADILAGISIAGLILGGFNYQIACLLFSTIGLYGGGVVFNDVFDYKLDKIERPERPLPSGKVSLFQAKILGVSLLIAGIILALIASKVSGLIALITAILALTYNNFSKHHTIIGPINMGLCRSFNLLLGVSISLSALSSLWFVSVIPLVFIADITLTSQGEVTGKNKSRLWFALLLDFLVIGFFIGLHFFTPYNLLMAIPFLGLWLWMNSGSKLKAIQNNQPKLIQKAVKMGVLSLIPLNAAIASGFTNIWVGLLVLLLLPISFALARYFAVT